jgi:hypothetical protein
MFDGGDLTADQHRVAHLTRHFQVLTPDPIELTEEVPVELEFTASGRYAAYDLIIPYDRELTVQVEVRGEVKITANGETLMDYRQTHLPGQPPREGWQEGLREVVVWPEQFVDGVVRLGIENPFIKSGRPDIRKLRVCSGDSMRWRSEETPLIGARLIDGEFVPDATLSDPAWRQANPLALQTEALTGSNVASEVRFLYDESNLYVGFRGVGRPTKPPHLASPTAGDGSDDIHGDDEFVVSTVAWEEFFSFLVDTGSDGEELVEFLINASGMRDATRSSRTGNEGYWRDSDLRRLRLKESKGEPPDRGSGFWDYQPIEPEAWFSTAEADEQGWSACLTIPFEIFGRSPSEGEVWRFNCCRRTYGEHRIEYMASPHEQMYYDSTRFAQLLFAEPTVLPVAADLGRRDQGDREARLVVCNLGNESRAVSGELEVAGDSIASRESVDLPSGAEGTLAFDFDPGDFSASSVRFVINDADGARLYQTVPLELRPPTPAAANLSDSDGGFSIAAAGADKPIDFAGEGERIELRGRRGDRAAFQVGVIPDRGQVRSIHCRPTDLVTDDGRTIVNSAVEWFLVAKLNRRPNPAYLLQRAEIANHQVRWVPDLLVPADSFSIVDGRPQAIWVEIGVPAEADLGTYRGGFQIWSDGCERSVSFELTVTGFPAASDERVIDVADVKQLFLDDFLVEEIEGARVRFHAFEKHSNNPLIVPDTPGELTTINLYGTILRDEETGRFRMWYCGQAFHESGHRYTVCYAESDDGLNWVKPNLGQVEFAGSMENNIVDLGVESHTPHPHVIYRPDHPDPSRRYMRFFQAFPVAGTCATYSSDGFEWHPESAPLLRASDAASPTYDPRTGRLYMGTIQDRVIGGFVRRSPAISACFEDGSWSDFQPILWADYYDDRKTYENLSRVRPVLSYDYPEHYHCEFNDFRPYPYAGLYLAGVTLFECPGSDIYKGTSGGRPSGKDDCSTHTRLAYSRSPDLTEWRWAPDRAPILDRGEPGRWDAGFFDTADAPVVVGDELWLYYGGMAFSQQFPCCQAYTGPAFKQGDVPSGIGLATMRLDGFASVESNGGSGRIVTRQLRFTGQRLELNGVVRGSLTVSVLDDQGKPVPGFSAGDCEPIRGDSVRHRVRWSGREDVRPLAGRPIRLEFHLNSAALYAFQFVS